MYLDVTLLLTIRYWNDFFSTEYLELFVVFVKEACFHLCYLNYLMFMSMILWVNLKVPVYDVTRPHNVCR